MVKIMVWSLLMTLAGGHGLSFLNTKMSHILCLLPFTPKCKMRNSLILLESEVIMVESLKKKTLKTFLMKMEFPMIYLAI